MTRVLIPLMAMALVGGCSPSEQGGGKAPVASATEATLPADAAQGAPAYSASSEGVGPVSSETRFSPEAIAALFPGSEVKAAFQNQEGVETPVLTVKGPGELVLEIQEGDQKGQVGRVLVQGGPVVGPRGEAIFESWSRFGLDRKDCLTGVEGQLLCRRPGEPSLAYVFAIPGYPGQAEAPPPPPPEAVMAEKAFLQAFLWQASPAP